VSYFFYIVVAVVMCDECVKIGMKKSFCKNAYEKLVIGTEVQCCCSYWSWRTLPDVCKVSDLVRWTVQSALKMQTSRNVKR